MFLRCPFTTKVSLYDFCVWHPCRAVALRAVVSNHRVCLASQGQGPDAILARAFGPFGGPLGPASPKEAARS